jgi:hypothetical protein
MIGKLEPNNKQTRGDWKLLPVPAPPAGALPPPPTPPDQEFTSSARVCLVSGSVGATMLHASLIARKGVGGHVTGGGDGVGEPGGGG